MPAKKKNDRNGYLLKAAEEARMRYTSPGTGRTYFLDSERTYGHDSSTGASSGSLESVGFKPQTTYKQSRAKKAVQGTRSVSRAAAAKRKPKRAR